MVARYNWANFMNKNLQKANRNIPGCLIDIEKKKQKQLDLHIKGRNIFVRNY